jgi:nucleotide-binding universal stress UspA family protein
MDSDGAARVAPALAPGQHIDGFVVGAHLHRGGMAQLWLVQRADAGAEAPLVIKAPHIGRGDDPAMAVCFEVEQMILPALTGPHAPHFVAKGGLTAQPYIVMERIQGESLKPRFDAAPIGIDEVTEIGWKVATALHDLHRQHVVHLDVKPSNVMFRAGQGGGRGDAVLVDYGLSRHDHLPDLLAEEFTLPLGTGPYMSPEQLRQVRNDPRSDLFALGVMLYHLVTGARPFGAPTTVRGLRQRLWREPVPPRALRADCPPWLQELILRCLEVDPLRRHQSAAQLALELRHPQQVVLGERAARVQPAKAWSHARRWFAVLRAGDARAPGAAMQAGNSPILLAAVDVAGAEPALLGAVLEAVSRALQGQPAARLACLTVLRSSRIGVDAAQSPGESSRHVQLLVQLKHWAHPLVRSLGLLAPGQAGRVTFHVIEAPEAAAAIVEYARRNQVDHIVVGARSSGRLRQHLGSVSAQVAAQAECSVTVVRLAGPAG